MLKAIFYARFHPERGPSVIHQYPANSIIPASGSDDKALFNFSDVSSYIIPPYEICNQPLSICTNGCRVLGFPVSLEDARYARNRFTFNVCFVLDENVDVRPWDQIVKKTARFVTACEQEDGILQAEELLEGLKWAGEAGYPGKGIGVIYTLLKTMLEDLNAYSETCVRLSDLHVLNLRLVTPKPGPAKVKAWDVPLLIRPVPSQDEWTWDLTLQRIHSHIDGIKHVQRIAELADVELKLVKKAVQELVYHARVLILDIFHFQAVYTTTATFALFVTETDLQKECCSYISTDPSKNIFQAGSEITARPTEGLVIDLYRQLIPGTTLEVFCSSHEKEMAYIDIRRFITFGVIKGFLRRMHKYPLANATQNSPPYLQLSNGSSLARAKAGEESAIEFERAWRKAALSSGWSTPPMQQPVVMSLDIDGREEASLEDERLRKFLNGKHCMDEICVSLHMSEKNIKEKFRNGRFGNVVMLCR